MIVLPELLPEYEPTRATLHAYAEVMSAIPRAHADPQPHWWHVAFTLVPDGFAAAPIPLADGSSLELVMDLRRHEIVAAAGGEVVLRLDLTAGTTATMLAEPLLGVADRFGLSRTYDHAKFETDEPRPYDPTAATTYLDAFIGVEAIMARYRTGLRGRVGPIHVWPHHFDMSFEWFGTREVVTDSVTYPSQLNLGFDPADGGYFYSNPWPLAPELVGRPLPHGAVWHTEGWEGTSLSYEMVRTGNPRVMVIDFARAVFDLAEPTLLA